MEEIRLVLTALVISIFGIAFGLVIIRLELGKWIWNL
jgi:hypothetical protein